MTATRDHGGRLDMAVARHGGGISDWLDLSTGINPVPYPLPPIPAAAWARLPDHGAIAALADRARAFWQVPDGWDILAAPGASALIARIPDLAAPGQVWIPGPTYNEHGAAFARAGWRECPAPGGGADATVIVHPNNPDGRVTQHVARGSRLSVIDESFCDVAPGASHVGRMGIPGTIILKSFGKFWGLGGLRLGFAIGDPALVDRLRHMLGPWPVAGPALAVGSAALADPGWASATRQRLQHDADRLDRLMTAAGARVTGGTTLFRLYTVDDAAAWQARLARGRVWSRIFPYSDRWLRLGLPGPGDWAQLEAAI